MSNWRKRRIGERMSAPRRESLPTKNPTLAILVRAAQEDGELRIFFRHLAELKERERKVFLNRIMEDAERREAPAEFRDALASLRDPGVLEKLLKLL